MVHRQICSMFPKINKYVRLIYTQHVQCIQKVFRPLHFSHILLCCNLLNLFNFFPNFSLHSIQVNDNAETEIESVILRSWVLQTRFSLRMSLLLVQFSLNQKAWCCHDHASVQQFNQQFHHTRECCFLQSECPLSALLQFQAGFQALLQRRGFSLAILL